MPRPLWATRRDPVQPFTPQEDAELAQMVRCGLSSDYYGTSLPGRPFGQILERRLQLIETGQMHRARDI